MSENNNNNKQNMHIHTYTYTHHKRFNIYLPETFQPTYSKLKKILRREGTSISEWFRKQAEEYVRRHDPGNPQQILERFVKHRRPYFAPAKCSLKPCGREAVVVAEWKDGRRYYVCSVHLETVVKRSKDWRIIGPVGAQDSSRSQSPGQSDKFKEEETS